MRAATNECVKSDTALYAVDTRGLQALNPVGDASKGSIRGTSAYSGACDAEPVELELQLAGDAGHAGQRYRAASCLSTRTTLARRSSRCSTIPRRTTSSALHSTNKKRDGTYRHLTITLLNHPEAKLEYRPGYYAPADFQHAKTEDRELALD